MKLILWDIDGTLIHSRAAGEGAVKEALKVCFDVDGELVTIDYFGRTDILICHMLFDYYKIPWTPENQRQYLEAYVTALRKLMPVETNKVLPGVPGLIEEIRNRNDMAQGLLTGNIVKGAQIKLEHFDIWKYFEFGAFADDSHIRNELGPFALQRANDRYGRDFLPQDVYIVGDTPHDIACAKVIGANSIAVATGAHTVEELQSHHPTALLKDFSDRQEFFKVLEG